jgi:tetratricopeptide (TPR) repeat protein
MIKRFFPPGIFLLLLWLLANSNPPPGAFHSPSAIWDSLLHVEQAPPTRMSQQQKLALVLSLRQAFENEKFPEDSVYARILHRIAVYQYNTTKEYNKCVENTLHALRINTSGAKGACLSFAVVSYKNMGYYYKGLLFYDRALVYFDSAIRLGKRFPAQVNEVKACHQEQSNIYSIKGDFEKCIEAATVGIRLGEDTKDTSYRIKLLKQRGFAEEELGLYTAATSDIGLDRQFSLIRKDTPALAGSLDIQAHIDIATGRIDRALSEYQQAIRLQSALGPSSILVEYYIDQGNLLM